MKRAVILICTFLMVLVFGFTNAIAEFVQTPVMLTVVFPDNTTIEDEKVWYASKVAGTILIVSDSCEISFADPHREFSHLVFNDEVATIDMINIGYDENGEILFKNEETSFTIENSKAEPEWECTERGGKTYLKITAYNEVGDVIQIFEVTLDTIDKK